MANGFFAGAEIALLAVRTTRLRELQGEGSQAARMALALRAMPERFMATVQVGITVISATAAVLSGATFERPLEIMLHGLGLETGVDIDQVRAASTAIEPLVGHPLPSRYVRATKIQRAST